jgi:predicted nucleotidyltransferase
MIYSLEQIKEIAVPIAIKYNLNALWVFGSYACGEATEESDVDFLMDYTDSIAKTFIGFVDLSNEFKQTFNKKIDLISTSSLYSQRMEKYFAFFMNRVTKERILIYENDRS